MSTRSFRGGIKHNPPLLALIGLRISTSLVVSSVTRGDGYYVFVKTGNAAKLKKIRGKLTDVDNVRDKVGKMRIFITNTG